MDKKEDTINDLMKILRRANLNLQEKASILYNTVGRMYERGSYSPYCIMEYGLTPLGSLKET